MVAMFLQQSQKCKRLGTSTYSMLTVDRRRLLQWTYFAELSYLPLERQELSPLLPLCTFLPLKMAAASAYFRSASAQRRSDRVKSPVIILITCAICTLWRADLLPRPEF